MTLETIQSEYVKWIRDNTHFTNVLNDAIEVSSPFIDALSENIKLYIEPHSNRFKITDDGYTIWNLESLGSQIRKNSQRNLMLLNVVDRYSISYDENNKELYIYATQDEIGQAIHSLLQSTLAISDLLQINKKNIKNLFFEEVSSFFDDNNEIFDPFPDIEIQGKSKLTHRFDYLMYVKNKEKKLVRLINNIDQIQLERALLSWQDTSKQRIKRYKENLSMVVLVNDKNRPISSEFDEAFREYNIEPIEFSDKAAVKKSLSLVG